MHVDLISFVNTLGLPNLKVFTESDDDDFKKQRKKKGHKIAISDSDDDDFPSTSKGKIRTLIVDPCHFTKICLWVCDVTFELLVTFSVIEIQDSCR